MISDLTHSYYTSCMIRLSRTYHTNVPRNRPVLLRLPINTDKKSGEDRSRLISVRHKRYHCKNIQNMALATLSDKRGKGKFIWKNFTISKSYLKHMITEYIRSTEIKTYIRTCYKRLCSKMSMHDRHYMLYVNLTSTAMQPQYTCERDLKWSVHQGNHKKPRQLTLQFASFRFPVKFKATFMSFGCMG